MYTLLTNACGIIHCPLFYVGMYTFNARVVKLTVLICSKVHAEVGMCACVRTITRRCHVSVYKPLKQKSAKDPTSGQAAPAPFSILSEGNKMLLYIVSFEVAHKEMGRPNIEH